MGAVLSLLDGPVVCDPAFCVVWFRFRLMRRYLAYRPEEVSRVYRLLAAAAEGCSGHGPAHLLVESAAEIGFSWCSQVPGWNRTGLPVLSMMAGPIKHFRAAVFGAWRHRVSMDLCSRKGFRGGPFLDVSGTMQLLNSDHVRERDKALLRGVLVGGVWNGFLLGKVKGCHVLCRFCGGDDNDDHLFWDCTFPPLVEIRENPEFHELMEMDKSCWPGCLLWHGWLPMLSGVNRGSPWAGRRRVSPAVTDARRNLSGVCARWYPVVLDLHRFFIAISRAVVNHDDLGGTAPDPLVWSAGALRKRRRLVHAVRDRAFLPGPPGIWSSDWFQVPGTVVCAEDVALWPYTPGLLVKWVSFLSTLHWPVGDLDLGVGGISYVELLILYELWAGERLFLEKAHPRYLRPGRPISVSAVPFGPGIDIWRSCRFIGALIMRSLCLLPGGLRRFVPCSIGANHCRLRHIGWEKCGHGLTSRPRESASELFLNELLSLFRYPSRSGRALLNGTLPLRYCAVRFAHCTPTWRIPVSGQVIV